MTLTEKIERAKICVSFESRLSSMGNCIRRGYAPFDCDRCGSYEMKESGTTAEADEKACQPKNCKLCGTKMVWENPHIPGYFHASSCDIDDWPICHDCMVEHCCQTNCLGCGYGKYPDCRHLELKRHYMSND